LIKLRQDCALELSRQAFDHTLEIGRMKSIATADHSNIRLQIVINQAYNIITRRKPYAKMTNTRMRSRVCSY